MRLEQSRADEKRFAQAEREANEERSNEMPKDLVPVCIGCDKKPEELDEYVAMGKENDCTPSQFVKAEEGTYNPWNGHFMCTDCYIKAGQPSLHAPRRWIAP